MRFSFLAVIFALTASMYVSAACAHPGQYCVRSSDCCHNHPCVPDNPTCLSLGLRSACSIFQIARGPERHVVTVGRVLLSLWYHV
ncbi:uncharacterized protein EDB93DRAFT_1165458 [Suillus bovinus]|uniref:uncharacterized protein n=1 Tax=Suillus bovinus TaxID=48563 RepID=UPI001B88519F|nr:uncharacterized protein EDB93DRAFT_1165458 [Suillus bovinus]KAG2138409.1 hypothetical protein EDB93DRAFT_1165458 [Suillus bovinus]